MGENEKTRCFELPDLHVQQPAGCSKKVSAADGSWILIDAGLGVGVGVGV